MGNGPKDFDILGLSDSDTPRVESQKENLTYIMRKAEKGSSCEADRSAYPPPPPQSDQLTKKSRAQGK
jgi:hypothetical protein